MNLLGPDLPVAKCQYISNTLESWDVNYQNQCSKKKKICICPKYTTAFCFIILDPENSKRNVNGK